MSYKSNPGKYYLEPWPENLAMGIECYYAFNARHNGKIDERFVQFIHNFDYSEILDYLYPEDHKEVFIKHMVQHMSLGEIAAERKCSVSAVYNRYRLAAIQCYRIVQSTFCGESLTPVIHAKFLHNYPGNMLMDLSPMISLAAREIRHYDRSMPYLYYDTDRLIELQDELMKHLDYMPDIDRMILVMKYKEKATMNEISEASGRKVTPVVITEILRDLAFHVCSKYGMQTVWKIYLPGKYRKWVIKHKLFNLVDLVNTVSTTVDIDWPDRYLCEYVQGAVAELANMKG